MSVEGAVLSEVAGRKQLSDQVDASSHFVLPALKALNDVGMVQLEACAYVFGNSRELLWREVVGLRANFAPCDVDAILRIECFVDLLESALANQLC